MMEVTRSVPVLNADTFSMNTLKPGGAALLMDANREEFLANL